MQHPRPNQYNDCIFCENDNHDGISLMMLEALQAKHAVSQSQGLIGYIDVIMNLEEPCSAEEAYASAQFRQHNVIDEHDEFLKREYKENEFEGKLTMLTEYYKFHADIPRVVEPGIEKILGRYYDKKREYDYKKIKRLLKEEQGLSITSVQQSESSYGGDSQVEKRSRYSTLLDVLEESKVNGEDNMMSDSKLLKDMCKQIEKALPSNKYDGVFQVKGSFSNDRIFQQYLKQEEERLKQKLRERNRQRLGGNNRKSTRLNLEDLLKKGREKVKIDKDTIDRDPRKKQKDNKFIYNTNIKIEIKNAMFYSQGDNPLQLGNIEYESGNKQQSRFRKKNLINQVNFLNHNQSSRKMLADIYKSSGIDLKKRTNITPNKQRLATKESFNRSQSKDKKKTSFIKQQSVEAKKTLSGSHSARKIVYNGVGDWTRSTSIVSKQPIKSISSSNLKKRSASLNGGSSTSVSAKKLIDKKPIESISRYGSSDIKASTIEVLSRGPRSISIKDILSRKLQN